MSDTVDILACRPLPPATIYLRRYREPNARVWHLEGALFGGGVPVYSLRSGSATLHLTSLGLAELEDISEPYVSPPLEPREARPRVGLIRYCYAHARYHHERWCPSCWKGDS